MALLGPPPTQLTVFVVAAHRAQHLLSSPVVAIQRHGVFADALRVSDVFVCAARERGACSPTISTRPT